MRSLAIAASLTRTAGIKARHLVVRLSNIVLRGYPDCWVSAICLASRTPVALAHEMRVEIDLFREHGSRRDSRINLFNNPKTGAMVVVGASTKSEPRRTRRICHVRKLRAHLHFADARPRSSISTVAVMPADRTTPAATSSIWIRTGMRWVPDAPR